MPGIGDSYRTEGRHAAIEARERTIFWDPGTINLRQIVDSAAKIVSTAVDPTNTPTTELREGLLLGKIKSSGDLKQYDPTATDGSQYPFAVLVAPVNMLDAQNVARDRRAPVARGGCVIASMIIGLDARARGYMFGAFHFDDDFLGNRNPFPGAEAHQTDYTVTAEDMRRGKIFTNKGATQHLNFTLPAPFVGGYAKFFAEASRPMGIRGAANNQLVGPNNAEAESIAFATEGFIVGSYMDVFANSDGTKWLVAVHEANPGPGVTVNSSSG